MHVAHLIILTPIVSKFMFEELGVGRATISTFFKRCVVFPRGNFNSVTWEPNERRKYKNPPLDLLKSMLVLNAK